MSRLLVYLDADVLVSSFGPGPNERRAKRIISDIRSVVMSDWTRVEVASALSREVRSGRMTASQAADVLTRIDSWASDIATTERSAVDLADAQRLLERFDLKLRAGDALHLAISRRLGAYLATFDNDLASAAKTLGQGLLRG